VKVKVHLHTIYQKITPQGPIRELEVDLERGSTLDNLMALLNLDIDEANTLFVIQGQIVEKEMKLSEGDEVHFIPAISGGGF